ncbi:MAG TPA: hypothetical protein VM487_00065 [Phycisphaerae bacterium]|nr:hypothetical protein [Phycisphaerae bacterium]
MSDADAPGSGSPSGTAAYARSTALARLRQNVKRQGFVPTEGNPAYALIDGRKTTLPAYVPYVGRWYFAYRPRILCYAINQNLSKHTSWTDEWAAKWGRDTDLAIDRLNRAASDGEPIAVKPYVEGFIPLVALLAIVRHRQVEGAELPKLVDEVIAVTNFVKFSTSDDASSSSIFSSWWRECAKRYVARETVALKPDVIIAFGQKTVSALSQVVKDLSFEAHPPETLACRFPGRMPSIKARPLTDTEERVWRDHILPLVGRIRPPNENAYHRWRMLSFPGYFVDIARGWLPALF